MLTFSEFHFKQIEINLYYSNYYYNLFFTICHFHFIAPVDALVRVPSPYFDTVCHLVTTVPDVDKSFSIAANSILEHFISNHGSPIDVATDRLRFLIQKVEQSLHI